MFLFLYKDYFFNIRTLESLFIKIKFIKVKVKKCKKI